jgi:DNA-binding transcriptional MerR regulator
MTEDQSKPTLKIGQLARRVDLNVRTLRYYEALGLLPAPQRTESGYRLYSGADERRLRFVLQAKRVGLSLEEIGRILELGRHGSACGYVRETVSRHIEDLDARIAELQAMRAELSAASAAWEEGVEGPPGEVCGLIENWVASMVKGDEAMAIRKKHVELFTAGCQVCEPAVELVQRVACPHCDVTIHNVRDDPKAASRAKAAHVARLPMVLVDGKPLECCHIGPVTEAALRAAGVGKA